ncbi:hypothetical protein PFISCL1PPCAC_16269, partial [Pristionchus fissidentatus]
MGSRWVDGVVTTLHIGAENVVYVHTWDGIAIYYSRFRDPRVRLGAYVRVRVSPRSKDAEHMEVEELS